MGIIIETNFFINAERSKAALGQLDKLYKEYGSSHMAAITVSELLAGVHKAKSTEIRVVRSSFVEKIIANIPVISFDEKVARIYSELYVDKLKPKGGNVHDLQIAATAISYGFHVLTSNQSDFISIPGVKVIVI